MPTRFLCTILSIFVLTFAYAEPPNLSHLKHEIHSYYDSGQYQRELQRVINRAQRYIIQRALVNQHTKMHRKLALVLDIDETSLSNYKNIKQNDFAANLKQINMALMRADDPAIKPTLALYKTAQSKGIKVYFVTGRPESLRNATQQNLINAGFTNWAGLYMRPEIYTYKSIVPFKSKARSLISAKGYTIIATIGDQYSDIVGGYAQKGYKLPNPFYYLP